MATCEMKDHIEDNNYNRYAIDFELLVTLDELDEQYELAWPESLNPSSASQNQDDILEDFCLFADILLPGTRKEEINDLNNSTSWCTEDTSSMQEKEGGKGQKQEDVDLSFLDAFDIEELCGKEPEINDIEIVSRQVSRRRVMHRLAAGKPYVEPAITEDLQTLLTRDRFTYLGSTVTRAVNINDKTSTRIWQTTRKCVKARRH